MTPEPRRTKDPRPDSVARPCYQCGVDRAKPGQNGFCSPACRFWSKVDKTDGCWLWTGAKHTSKGYGRLDASGRRWLAHRYAYTLLIGPFPEELELDHLCRNTSCVNPDHLDPVTSEVHDNERTDQGAYNRAKAECPAGHEYTPENIRWQGVRRHCRACDRTTGTGLSGSYNGNAKLTEEIVIEARSLRSAGARVDHLAQRYCVAKSVMSRALSGRTWSHV